jgi:hypothetical protein
MPVIRLISYALKQLVLQKHLLDRRDQHIREGAKEYVLLKDSKVAKYITAQASAIEPKAMKSSAIAWDEAAIAERTNGLTCWSTRKV